MTAVPIAIFAFKRLDLLKKTLAALERSKGFPGGPLHVFSDAPREAVPAEAAQVGALRDWLKPWCARHGAVLHEAAGNQGLRHSIISGVSALLKDYERVIVIEDDILVSPGFLPFMHEGLKAFQERDEVMQISGYFVPHRQNLPAAGMLRVPACWGWATWRRAWQHYSDDAAALLSAIRARDVQAFDLNGSYANVEALEKNAQGTLNTWFVRWYASVFLRGGMTVYPGLSLVRNTGFGEDATNCGKGGISRVFRRQKVNSCVPHVDWKALPLEEDPNFFRALEAFYHWQNRQWGRPTWRQVWRARWRRLTGRNWRESVHAE